LPQWFLNGRREWLKNPFWTALLTRFSRVYVEGYTAPSKIGSRLARMVFERPPGVVEKSILDCVAWRF
jgi:hypothetical protein